MSSDMRNQVWWITHLMREEVRNLLLARSAMSCFVGNGTLEKWGLSGILLKRIVDIKNMIGGRGQWIAGKKDRKGQDKNSFG